MKSGKNIIRQAFFHIHKALQDIYNSIVRASGKQRCFTLIGNNQILFMNKGVFRNLISNFINKSLFVEDRVHIDYFKNLNILTRKTASPAITRRLLLLILINLYMFSYTVGRKVYIFQILFSCGFSCRLTSEIVFSPRRGHNDMEKDCNQ